MLESEALATMSIFVAGSCAATILLWFCGLTPAWRERERERDRALRLEADAASATVEAAAARIEAIGAHRRCRELEVRLAEAKGNLDWAIARTGDAERELARSQITIERLRRGAGSLELLARTGEKPTTLEAP